MGAWRPVRKTPLRPDRSPASRWGNLFGRDAVWQTLPSSMPWEMKLICSSGDWVVLCVAIGSIIRLLIGCKLLRAVKYSEPTGGTELYDGGHHDADTGTYPTDNATHLPSAVFNQATPRRVTALPDTSPAVTRALASRVAEEEELLRASHRAERTPRRLAQGRASMSVCNRRTDYRHRSCRPR